MDWYDYGARFYDPALGRFTTQDRFAEKYLDLTPYQYAANNPILFIDVNGDSIFGGFANSEDGADIWEGLESFAATDEGKSFLLSYMYDGEEIEQIGLKAEGNGTLSGQNLYFGTGVQDDVDVFHDISEDDQSVWGKGPKRDRAELTADFTELAETQKFDLAIIIDNDGDRSPSGYKGTFEKLSKATTEVRVGVYKILDKLNSGINPGSDELFTIYRNEVEYPIRTKDN